MSAHSLNRHVLISCAHSVPQKKGGIKVDPTMFPDEASDAFPLDRCMRVLPHHGEPLQ